MKAGYILTGIFALIILGLILKNSDQFKVLADSLSQSIGFMISGIVGPKTG